jgi:hypothetical protein
MSKPIVISTTEWEPTSIKFMPPKLNASGVMKNVNVISTQTNRSLHISAPMMMTWGISDYDDGSGGDGRFNMTLNFPTEEYRKPSTDIFLEKVIAFENQIIDKAVQNSELWFGDEQSREVCKHSFYPFVKFPMIKGTKKVDTTKSPSIRGKVPCYDGKWAIELYDTKENMIYPCDNDRVTPPDFVPKLSQVACVLQCGGIWLGQKGWGVTWKVIQCVVKPREVVSVYGQCRVMLSEEERGAIETQQINDDDSTEIGSDTVFTKTEAAVHDVAAEDSDEDADMPEIVAATPEVINVAPTPVAKEVIEEAPVVKKKKMVKKKKVVEAEA